MCPERTREERHNNGRGKEENSIDRSRTTQEDYEHGTEGEKTGAGKREKYLTLTRDCA